MHPPRLVRPGRPSSIETRRGARSQRAVSPLLATSPRASPDARPRRTTLAAPQGSRPDRKLPKPRSGGRSPSPGWSEGETLGRPHVGESPEGAAGTHAAALPSRDMAARHIRGRAYTPRGFHGGTVSAERFGDGARINNFHSTAEMGNGLLNSVCGFRPWYAEARHKITLAF